MQVFQFSSSIRGRLAPEHVLLREIKHLEFSTLAALDVGVELLAQSNNLLKFLLDNLDLLLIELAFVAKTYGLFPLLINLRRYAIHFLILFRIISF